MKSATSSKAFCLFEILERRQLFSAGFPISGTYSNNRGDTVEILDLGPFNGGPSEYNVKTTFVTNNVETGVTRTVTSEFVASFEQVASGDFQEFDMDLPPGVGDGEIRIQINADGGRVASSTADANPEIFGPVQEDASDLSDVTPKAKSSSAEAITSASPVAAATLAQSKTALLGGSYIGSFRRTTDNQVFKLKVSFHLNKAGHIAMDADFIIPGFGDVLIQTVVHPTHTGTFSVPVGDNALAGTFSAHLSHTGRLVSRLAVPTISIETGSLKKHGS